MQRSSQLSKHIQNGKILFLLSFFVAAYWIISKNTNVYQTKITGAIFEMLWLPMLLLLFVTPCLAIYFWKSEKFILKSFNLLVVVVFLITLILLFR
jgi:hypothetical protein